MWVWFWNLVYTDSRGPSSDHSYVYHIWLCACLIVFQVLGLCIYVILKWVCPDSNGPSSDCSYIPCLFMPCIVLLPVLTLHMYVVLNIVCLDSHDPSLRSLKYASLSIMFIVLPWSSSCRLVVCIVLVMYICIHILLVHEFTPTSVAIVLHMACDHIHEWIARSLTLLLLFWHVVIPYPCMITLILVFLCYWLVYDLWSGYIHVWTSCSPPLPLHVWLTISRISTYECPAPYCYGHYYPLNSWVDFLLVSTIFVLSCQHGFIF